MPLYFDTDAFHHLTTALQGHELDPAIRQNIVLSPITILEVLSKLTLNRAEDILKQIHALRNLLNQDRAGILPWPTAAISQYGFNKDYDDGDFTERLGKAINVCLQSEGAACLKPAAAELKDMLDAAKDQTVTEFRQLLDVARRDRFNQNELPAIFVAGLARRTGAELNPPAPEEVLEAISAYWEFEKEKLKIALQNPRYNPDNHANDLLDSEQLVYLADRRLHFLTCDRGFARASASHQYERVHIVERDALLDWAKAVATIERWGCA